MAVKGSGIGSGPDPKMVDQTHYDARKGAAKKPHTTFADSVGHEGSEQAPPASQRAVAPIHPGVGPDARAADVMDPETPAERGRTLRRQPGGAGAQTSNGSWVPGKLQSAWGMKGGDGQGVDNDMSGKVLGEAILSGSTKLPAAVDLKTDSGAAPKPFPTPDRGG